MKVDIQIISVHSLLKISTYLVLLAIAAIKMLLRNLLSCPASLEYLPSYSHFIPNILNFMLRITVGVFQ